MTSTGYGFRLCPTCRIMPVVDSTFCGAVVVYVALCPTCYRSISLTTFADEEPQEAIERLRKAWIMDARTPKERRMKD